MLERYNKFVATDDPDEFRYYDVLKAMNIKASSTVYVSDSDKFSGYIIQLVLLVNGVPCVSQKMIPIASLEALDDDVLEMYIDNLYNEMIGGLFDAMIKV